MLQAIGKHHSTSIIMQIATFVFVDLEPTGLPEEENNRTKVIEICMIAVSRDHLLLTRPGATPRVQDKLKLCINPLKMISPICTKVTGLDNDILEHKTSFNADVCDLINSFLKLLPKPVCLIAQNGLNFDFPIIKQHFDKMSMNLIEDLMCADCYHAFYDIMEARKKVEEQILNSTINISFEDKSPDISKDKNGNDGNKPSMNRENYKTLEESHDASALKQPITDESLFSENDIIEFMKDFTETEAEELRRQRMKLVNETTPKKPIRQQQPCQITKRTSSVDKVRRRFPFSIDNRPKESYKLKNIYRRLLNRTAHDAHHAESDCIYALEIAVVLGEEFVSWVDNNCCSFADVKPMTQGVRIGL